MKTLKSIDLMSAALYGAVLVAFFTFVFGFYYWLLGWAFGAQAWFIDMNLVNWTAYTFSTFLTVVWHSLINGLGGAFSAFFAALVYNVIAGMSGGLKLELE